MGTEMKSIGKSRRRLVSEISIHKNIRTDVVERVLDGLVDVATEEIVNTGEFYLRGLFTVKPVAYSAYTAGGGVKISAHQRINPSLGGVVKALWKIRHTVFGGATGKITRDNWRQVLTENTEKSTSAKTTTSPRVTGSSSESEAKSDPTDYNPFAEGYWSEDEM